MEQGGRWCSPSKELDGEASQGGRRRDCSAAFGAELGDKSEQGFSGRLGGTARLLVALRSGTRGQGHRWSSAARETRSGHRNSYSLYYIFLRVMCYDILFILLYMTARFMSFYKPGVTEAINTACHASNRVYLHRFLGKTPYELLVGVH